VERLEIIQIVGLGLIAALMALLIREQKPVFAMLLALIFGASVFVFLIGKIGSVIAVFEDLAARSQIDSVFLKTILKIVGIAYIAEFGAQTVRDAGHESIAGKIEMAGKILILFMAIPIIRVIIETVVQLLPA
jgi:stage III sporulation protein AD